MNVIMLQNGVEIAKGDQADVREKIEDMICERLGFSPSLQESTDDDEYEVYLHTEGCEGLSAEEIDKLVELGISEYGEESTAAIKKLLNVEFVLVS